MAPAPVQSSSGGFFSSIADGTAAQIYIFSLINTLSCITTELISSSIFFFFLICLLTFFIFIGWAFGTGIAMGHRAVDSVMGPPTIKHETVVSVWKLAFRYAI